MRAKKAKLEAAEVTHTEVSDDSGADFDRVSYVYVSMSAKPRYIKFPVSLRKMWTGQEVQQWLDQNVNGENNQ
jgi:hypothetical protein